MHEHMCHTDMPTHPHRQYHPLMRCRGTQVVSSTPPMRTQSDEGVTGSRVECYPALEHRPGHSHIHTPTDPGESQSRTMSLKNAFLTVPNEAASGETYLCTATGCQLLWDSSEFHWQWPWHLSGPARAQGTFRSLKILRPGNH